MCSYYLKYATFMSVKDDAEKTKTISKTLKPNRFSGCCNSRMKS